MPHVQVDQAWLDAHGGLNDNRISVRQSGADLHIEVGDANWNSEGLTDYEGPEPGRLEVRGLVTMPRIDPGVLSELVSDTFISAGSNQVELTIICFGRHRLEAIGNEVVWVPYVSSDKR